jgi:hypothetical protein
MTISANIQTRQQHVFYDTTEFTCEWYVISTKSLINYLKYFTQSNLFSEQIRGPHLKREFWNQVYCYDHTRDGTHICCSCRRFEVCVTEDLFIRKKGRRRLIFLLKKKRTSLIRLPRSIIIIVFNYACNILS